MLVSQNVQQFLQIVRSTTRYIDTIVKAYNFNSYSGVAPVMVVMKVVIQPKGSVDLNAPPVQEAVLKHVSLFLTLGDVIKNTKLLWMS